MTFGKSSLMMHKFAKQLDELVRDKNPDEVFQKGANNSSDVAQDQLNKREKKQVRKQMPDSRFRGQGKKVLLREQLLREEVERVELKHKEADCLISCLCAHTKCLKEYCNCFSNGYFCDWRCKCKTCCNTTQHEQKIKDAIVTCKLR